MNISRNFCFLFLHSLNPINEYIVDCEVDIQDTHCFDFNAPDAGVHSVLKGGVRNLTRAKCVDHITQSR